MATKLPSGAYRSQVFVGYNDKGRRVYKSFTAETAKKADFLALQWQAKHPSVRVAGTALEAALEAYIKAKDRVLSPSTLRSYHAMERTLKKDYRPLMKRKIDMITQADMQTFVNSMAASSSPKTVRNYYGLLGAVFKVNGIDLPDCTLPQKVKPDYNIPDEKTIKKLFDGCKGTNLEIPILLAAIGPMRRGEIVGVNINDLDGNVLHVHRCAVVGADNKQVIKEYPKTFESDRYIILPQEVVDKINEQGYIYNGTLHSITDSFPRLLRNLGIEHFRFHDLRHAFVSIAHAAGLPDAYIQARGGWSTTYTMNNVYKHTLGEDKRKAQDKINGVFESLM